MPFQSEKQRRYLHANHPEIAKRWEREYAGGGITRLGFYVGGSHHAGSTTDSGAFEKSTRNGGPKKQPPRKDILPEIFPKKKTKFITKKEEKVPIIPKTKKFVNEKIIEPIKKIPQKFTHWSVAPINTVMKKQLTKERMKYLENLYDKDVSSFPPEIQNLIKEGNLHTDEALQFLDKEGKFGEYKLTKDYNPGLVMTGDMSGFHLMDKPDWYDGSSTEWEIFKQDVIQKRNLTTGQGNDREFRPPPEFRKSPKLSPINKPVNELMKGYEGWRADNPDAHSGTGTWALIEVILPDGTPHTFSGSAEANAFAKYLESIGSEPYTVVTNEEKISTFAKGGISNHFSNRKNYFDGGILDITGDEEITTDDGNDIALTAFNAAFDDPNDLSTGVKTLFRAKDGGTPQLAKKSKDGTRPGYRGSDWGPGAGSPGTTSSGDNKNTGNQGSDNQGSDKGHSRFDVGSGYYGETKKTPSAPKNDDGGSTPSIGPSLHGGPKFKLTQAQKNKEINQILSKKQKWDDDKTKRSLWTGYKAFSSLANPIMLLEFVAKQRKMVKERIAEIEEDLRRLDALGYTPHPWEARGEGYGIKGDLEFEKYKLENPNRDYGDTGGDGPEVVPIPAIIEGYEEMASQPMSLLNMRDNKALYAALSEKWEKQRREKEQEYKDYGLLPDNAVDNTAVGAITMQANSGGLANLFRVKNQ